MEGDPIVIAAAVRTPIGRFGGTLEPLPAPALGAAAVGAALARSGVEPAEVDSVTFGMARQAGARPNPARQVLAGAGIPERAVAYTVNQACASGMKSIQLAADELRLGRATVAVAGGMESMSRVPFYLERMRNGYRLGDAPVVDAMYRDGFLCPLSEMIMGETAELLAQERDISRDQQDQFALESQQKAAAAIEAGRFADELAPVTVPGRKVDTVLEADEHPRPQTNLASLAKLPGVFAKENGTVTPGNASGITDGAAALVLMSAAEAERRGIEPLAVYLDGEVQGTDPKRMGLGPVPATNALFARRGWSLDDFGLFEVNEAFAAQVLACLAGAADPGRAPQRQRRRDRPRPPDRVHRRAHRRHPAPRDEAPRHRPRPGHAVRQRRPRHDHGLRPRMTVPPTMKIHSLIPLLLLAACGDPDTANVGEIGTAGTASAEPTFLDGANPNSDALTEALGQDTQEPGASAIPPRPQGPWKPTREPQFRFETEEISDEQLAEFFVEIDVSINEEPQGTMTFVFWPEKAPIAVRNFLRYADEGFYDGLIYHRVLRDFMIQGGSANNSASGKGPYGMIKGEFSDEARYDHRYGVLSMARSQDPNSAGSQFFVICGESQSTVGLNGGYASFGKMVHGVATLEAIADIQTAPQVGTGERSRPTKTAVMTEVRVKRGKPEVAEEVKRPAPDLNGEPEKIIIQHVLISMAGTRVPGITRTKEEAEELAATVKRRAEQGEDFSELVMELTDDAVSKETLPPGSYRMLNNNITDYEAMKAEMAIMKEVDELRTELMGKIQKGEITQQQAQEAFAEAGFMERLQKVQWFNRADMAGGFADVSFSLQVGEVGMAEYDPATSPFGWHIIKRIQ